MNEILIYVPLYDFTIAPIMRELDRVTGDFTVRMSSPGGEVFPSWGIARKVRELSEKGFKSTLKIDGISASMAGILAPFFDNVEAVDKARFMIHAPSGGDAKMLKSVAKDLASVFNARIDAEKFKTLTGLTIDEAMDPENKDKKDIWLSAEQALDLGLINKVIPLTPSMVNEIESCMKVAYGFVDESKHISITNEKEEPMTKEELQASHPALFNQVHSDGKEAGKKEEQIRTNSWLAHFNSDAEKVVAGIKEGKELTADVREELYVSAEMKKRTSTEGNANNADTSAEAGKEIEAALEDDLKLVKASL